MLRMAGRLQTRGREAQLRYRRQGSDETLTPGGEPEHREAILTSDQRQPAAPDNVRQDDLRAPEQAPSFPPGRYGDGERQER